MAAVVDYAQVLEQAQQLNLKSAYYNSGSFQYPKGERVNIVGWLGPDDPTIRTDLPATLVRVPPPYERNLSDRLDRMWREHLPGPAWVMPKSHWAFELDHGNGGWMEMALHTAGIEPATLRSRTDGSAIEFLLADTGFVGFVQTLLVNLVTSDFSVLFPGYRQLVTIHHHKQLWWETPDADFAETLASIGRSS